MMAFQAGGNQSAVEIKLKEGWHIYWENPGDTGMATQLESRGKILFPMPKVFELSGGLESYGYDGTVILFISNAPQDQPIELHWLACTNETCIPGRRALQIQKKDRDWSEAKNGLPVMFLGEVKPLNHAQGIFIDGVVELFPDEATELEIERVEYIHDGVLLYWKEAKPKNGKLFLRIRGDETPYKLIW